MNIKDQQNSCSSWFKELRDRICSEFEDIETEYSQEKSLENHKFQRKEWQRSGGGGGEMSIMKGNIFEKVGVNISTVHGEFSDEFKNQIPGASEDPTFWASGISLVAHMSSPLVPAIHMNTRFICTTKSWFGGGIDLNPMIENKEETQEFHTILQKTCDKYNKNYYRDFKKYCDEYFYIKHRKEARGVGGIFYDYLNNNDFEKDFNFTKDVGLAFLEIFPKLVRKNMYRKFSDKEREAQLIKRGRYAEFNLIYDRGTKFGLMTDGNIDAILMSLPPIAKWL
jgi:coproporphyrinogen III oxidase